ncbi:MAG TPA: hypothetical protein VF185_02295 [Patescibacteria group bacterium]
MGKEFRLGSDGECVLQIPPEGIPAPDISIEELQELKNDFRKKTTLPQNPFYELLIKGEISEREYTLSTLPFLNKNYPNWKKHYTLALDIAEEAYNTDDPIFINYPSRGPVLIDEIFISDMRDILETET